MSLREHNVRNHPLDGGLVVPVAKGQDATSAAGALDIVIGIRVRHQEALEEESMALLRLCTRFPFSTCSMI